MGEATRPSDSEIFDRLINVCENIPKLRMVLLPMGDDKPRIDAMLGCRWDEALGILQTQLAEADTDAMRFLYCSKLDGLGSMVKRWDIVEQAMAQYDELTDFLNDMPPLQKAVQHSRMSWAIHNEDWDRAEELGRDILSGPESSGTYRVFLPRVHDSLATMHLRMGQLDEVEKDLEIVERTINSGGFFQIARPFHLIRARLYRTRGLLEKARGNDYDELPAYLTGLTFIEDGFQYRMDGFGHELPLTAAATMKLAREHYQRLGKFERAVALGEIASGIEKRYRVEVG